MQTLSVISCDHDGDKSSNLLYCVDACSVTVDTPEDPIAPYATPPPKITHATFIIYDND